MSSCFASIVGPCRPAAPRGGKPRTLARVLERRGERVNER